MKRAPGLDILRAISVITILLHHFEPGRAFERSAIGPLFRFLYSWWPSMDLFFVFSGFLVTGLLLKELKREESVDVKRFFIRRGFKIYPAFFVFVPVACAFHALMGDAPQPTKILAEIFFMQDYFRGVFDHTWSLGVEEKFYLLLCLIFGMKNWVKSENGLKRLFIFFVCWASFTPALRAVTYFSIPWSQGTHYNPFHLRGDGLAIGSALAILYHWYPASLPKLAPKWFVAIGSLCFVPSLFYFYKVQWAYIYGFTLQSVGAALLVLGVIEFRLPSRGLRRWTSQLFCFIGYYSYSIYVWHFFYWGRVHSKLSAAFGLGPVANHLSMFVGAITLGCIFGMLIEGPMLRLRDKWFPSSNRKAENKSLVHAEVSSQPEVLKVV
jgi:peptidoglycan/LPS O-acetylase OafA/YrhL